jgi:hypothetical protein
VSCAICFGRDADTGVLCEACAEALDTSSPISPEQIEVRGARSTPAALIDVWGQPYHLDAKMSLGRSIGDAKIIVLDGSISRRHAELEHTTYWSVRDLGSTRGTFVNETRIDRATMLRHGDRLRFGDIAMFFAEAAPALDRRYDVPTYKLPERKRLAPGVEVALSLHVPSGGGAAFAVIDGRRITLTTPQYELLDLLARRMRDDAGKPADDRGFVAISELLRLSLDVPDPGEQHVRQLVYRVRRTLINAGIGDLIDVRRGVGYRLRCVPV